MIADPHLAPNLPHMVVVEGGPHAIKQYKKLMLRRIDWNKKDEHSMDAPMESEPQIQKKKPTCTLVWEGTSTPGVANKKKTFEKWKVVDIRTETEAKRLLTDRNMVHLWNMVINLSAERAIGNEEEDITKLLI